MGKFKQIVIRLFKIQPQDLPGQPALPESLPKIDDQVRAEIDRQVKEQVQEVIRGLVLPELQKTINEKLAPLAQNTPLQPTQAVPDFKDEAIKPENTAPPQPVLLPSIPTLSLEEEFPAVDEEPVSPLTVALENEPAKEEETQASGDLVGEPHELPTLGIESAPSQSEWETVPELVQAAPEEEVAPALDDSSPQLAESQVVEEPVLVETMPEQVAPAIEEDVLPLAEERPQEVEPVFVASALNPLPETVRIGIDFGTTTTAVSIRLGEEHLPEAILIGSDGRTPYMPSVVYFRPGSGSLEERAVVGEEAESYSDATRVVRSVKRCLGCEGGGCFERGRREVNTNERFPWCKLDGKIHLGDNEEILPSQVTFLIVREALRRAIKAVRERYQVDLTAENICLLPLNWGCGADFNLARRELLLSAAHEVGFQNISVENVVEEPILAGFAFSRFASEPEGRALIYDFGGGTLDVAVIEVDRIENKALRVTVLSTAGDNWLGGDDIDSLVYGEFLNQMGNAAGISSAAAENSLDPLERVSLRRMARTAKEQLSSVEIYSNTLFTGSKIFTMGLDRVQFDSLLEKSGLVKRSFEVVRRVCQLAFALDVAKKSDLLNSQEVVNFKLQDAPRVVDRVVLIGGVTKTPYIRQKLADMFGMAKIVEETVIEPVSAVAIGAAYPRERQNFSITHPPFGINLEYHVNATGEMKQLSIIKPYDDYNYFRYYINNANPAHIVLFTVLDENSSAKLVLCGVANNPTHTLVVSHCEMDG
jgi:molecular chaperone DnaK (HSP70)